MKPTREQILQARTRAETFGFEVLEHRYSVDWSRTNQDTRKGTTHAWTLTGVYLGQFRGHSKALEHGAAVTKFSGIWFTWEVQ
jgi:hypothetical protein